MNTLTPSEQTATLNLSYSGPAMPPSNKAYAIPGSRWYSCREELHNHSYTKPVDRLYTFLTEAERIENIRAFMKEVEDRLDLNPENRAQIHATTPNNKYVVIFPGPWWNRYGIRRQFLTAILRCGYQYIPPSQEADASVKTKSFDMALFSTNYTQNTKDATLYFLAGNTILTKGFKNKGWVNTMQGASGDKLAKMLIRGLEEFGPGVSAAKIEASSAAKMVP